MFATKFSRGAVTSALVIRLSHLPTPCKISLSDVAEVDPIFQKKKLKCAVPKNKYSHNFQIIASKTNQHGVIVYDPTLIQFGADILKIVAGGVFFVGS